MSVRSSEFARLAGVTVRTLRHYHQVGLLAEPRRHSNGYRAYDADHLVRVLRIRALAGLGLPLDRIPALLDDGSHDTAPDVDATLDGLDADLAARIEELTLQRVRLAELRAHGVSPDVPVDLAPYFAAFTEAGLPAGSTAVDRDHALVLHRLAGEDGLAELTTLYEHFSDPAIRDGLAAATVAFDRLGPHSPDTDVDAVTVGLVAAMRVVRDRLAASGGLAHAEFFTEAHAYLPHNDQQLRVLDRVREALATAPPA